MIGIAEGSHQAADQHDETQFVTPGSKPAASDMTPDFFGWALSMQQRSHAPFEGHHIAAPAGEANMQAKWIHFRNQLQKKTD